MVSDKGVVITLAWPNTTARGDERWYSMLKQLGIVKNLNFKVGHAAIILISLGDSLIRYYDFGRYITPRGFGRTRSLNTDPKLKFDTRARWTSNQRLDNLSEILLELESKSEATHGSGPILCSTNHCLNIKKCFHQAEYHVSRGIVKYGALAPNNNSCSRFVWKVIKSGHEQKWSRLYWHETIIPSPTSNVIGASEDSSVFWFEEGKLQRTSFNRWNGLKFFISQLSHNFMSGKAQLLPKDHLEYEIAPNPPGEVEALRLQWLSGIGESAWFALVHINNNDLVIQKIDHQGRSEFIQKYQLPGPILDPTSIIIEYGTDFQKAIISYNGIQYRLLPNNIFHHN